MYYIYDTPVSNDNITTITRYGMKFKLQKKNKMENNVYYSFTCPGMEKLLLIPQFANQYTEVEKKVAKMKQGRSLKEFEAVLKNFVQIVGRDQLPGENEGEIITTLACEYKDIGVTFEFLNNKLTLSNEFEIIQNNIFGNNILVQMHVYEEEEG